MKPLSVRARHTCLYLIIPVLLTGMGCRFVARALESFPTQTAVPMPTTWTPATHTPARPSLTSTPAVSPTPTKIPPSPTLRLTYTSTPTRPTPGILPTSIPQQTQLQVFEELWKIVDEEYLYADFNGLDWDAIYQEYRQRIEAGLSNEDFYQAMDEMIFRLGDEHSVFLSPDEVAREDAQFTGGFEYVGIGVLVSPVPERDRAVILIVFPGSPAQKAGLQSHDSILAVDEEPILDEEGRLRNILRGPEGSRVNLLVQTPGQEPRLVPLTRMRINSPVPVPHTVLTTPEGKRVGYLLLVTFADQTVADQIGKALQIMSFGNPLDGVIIDNRMNEGGADTVLSGALSYFTHGALGSFVSRKEERPFRVQNRDMLGSQKVPLVVLVGENTVSFGEIFAGVLLNIGRAYLIGETTLGNVEILWGYDFDDGSRAWIAHDIFRPLNNPQQNWEETGILPDMIMPVNWDEVTMDTDPAVKAALEYLDKIPK